MALTAQSIPAASSSSGQGHAYSYHDAVLPAGKSYAYALEILRFDGATQWFELGEARAHPQIYLPLIQN